MIDPITFDFDTLKTFEPNDIEVERGGRTFNYGIFLIGIASLAISLKLIFDVLKNNRKSINSAHEKN